MPANNEFWPLVKELFRFLSNMTALGVDEAGRLLTAYFGKVKKWSVRFIVAIFAPLIVVVPCLAFHAKAGWLYAAYVIWAGLVAVAWFLLLVPIYWAMRRAGRVFPSLREDILHIIGLIRNFLLLVIFLFSLLVLGLIFPRHMDQLLWAIGNKTGGVIAASVQQHEVTAEWNKLRWFNNTGDAQVWYSEDSSHRFRLWGAPGFDPDTGRELQPVKDETTRQKLIAQFEDERRRKQQEQAAAAETRRKQEKAAAEVRHKEELAAAEMAKREIEAKRVAEEKVVEMAKREIEAKRVAEEKAAVIAKQEAEVRRMAEEKAEAERQLQATRETLARYFPSPWLADQTARTDYGIIIARNASTVDSEAETLTQAIVAACPPKTTTTKILPAFAGDGKITAILTGDRSGITTLHLKDFFKNVIAGDFSVARSRNTSATETFSASLRLTVKSFDPATGAEKAAVVIEAKGVGFSEAGAETMAVERAVEQMKKKKLEAVLVL
ncbi:MAG: hypothetical protein WC740_04455 [Verrucomicrobiia bacterium]